jgi:1,4-alpha-glucan branching enzyme
MARTRGSKSGASAPKIGKKRVALTVHAPHAREVAVAGTFNEWDPSTRPLKREADGNWTVTFYLAPGKYEYRFVVDGIWIDDPCCTTRCWNQYGGENCILVVE